MHKYSVLNHPFEIPNLEVLDTIARHASRNEDIPDDARETLRSIAEHFVHRHSKYKSETDVVRVARAGLNSLNDQPSRANMSEAMFVECGRKGGVENGKN